MKSRLHLRIFKHCVSRYSLAMVSLLAIATITAFAAAPVHLDRKGDRWAVATLHKMSLEEKIGQMIMPWAHIEFMNVNSPDALQLREEMRKYHVGGFGVTVFADGASLAQKRAV